ncbi:MAG TPA: S41 family peptidase, partial [Puia sp.]
WFRCDGNEDLRGDSAAGDLRSEQYRQIDSEFVYLKLPRFNQGDVDRLDSLIRVNHSVIYHTRNLIIDLRGNPGGNAASSPKMIQLIYTNPIVYPPWQYRSSPEYIRSKEAVVADLKKNDPYHKLLSAESLLDRLRDHPGELVFAGDSMIRKADSVSRYPERVAFLIDRDAGSSSEFFTFEGKQSRKVTLFGQNTAGAMDYGEDQSFSLSCGKYLIFIPWGRNGWIERFHYRIDNIGFKPDVVIPSDCGDWIDFVRKYWAK